MIEREFVAQKLKEFQIKEEVVNTLGKVGHSDTKMSRTPLGEKITVFTSRPGLVVGRKGENIKELTKVLKKKFNLQNPQIEISEVQNINLDANIVAEMIASSLERFGSSKFKGIGHKVMTDVMGAGALGIEILISGKIPSARAKRWRFYQGYLKKSGDVAVEGVKKAYKTAELKTGTVGIQVRIMPPDLKLPDKITLKKETVKVEETSSDVKEVSAPNDTKAESKENDDPVKKEVKKTKKKKKEEQDVNSTADAEKTSVEEE